LIDQFGLFGLEKVSFTLLKFVGLVLLAVGARLMLA
jgi:transporter family-2 protein